MNNELMLSLIDDDTHNSEYYFFLNRNYYLVHTWTTSYTKIKSVLFKIFSERNEATIKCSCSHTNWISRIT